MGHLNRTAVGTTAIVIVAAYGAVSLRGADRSTVRANEYAALVPVFVANPGTINPAAKYVGVGGVKPIFFTNRDVRFLVGNAGRSAQLALEFVGGSQSPRMEAADPTGGVINILIGGAGDNTRRTRSAYRTIVYRDLWPGIDAAFRSTSTALKYEFSVAPGADASAIRIRYRGVEGVSLTSVGALALATVAGTLTDERPVSSQANRLVPTNFDLYADGTLGFRVGEYDHTRPLVIDPSLVYSTYLGSSGGDRGSAIAVDGSGAAYVAGASSWIDLPVTPGAYDTSWGGTANAPTYDAFVAKISPAGDHFEYVTYLGGSSNDEAFGIAVDGGGNAYVTGYTESDDFPVTAGAFRGTLGGGRHDGFLAKLNPSGSDLVYSTFFGAAAATNPRAVAVDGQGFAYLTGETLAGNLPTINAFQLQRTVTGKHDGFLLKFNPTGSAPVYGTYIGSSDEDYATAVAVDGSGHAYVTGSTASLDLVMSPTSVQSVPNSATYRSSDGGASWTPVNGITHAKHVLAIAIDPQMPTIVWEGTEDHAVLRSTDGGTNWYIVDNGLPPGTSVTDIAINPNTPTTLLAATSSGLYRTTNSGGQWNFVAAGATRVAIAPSNPSVAYAVVLPSGVIRSADGGATWTRVTPLSVTSLAIDPGNADVVYLGTDSGQVLKSTDGGKTASGQPLTTQPHQSISAIGVDPLAPNVIYAGFLDSGLYKSTNGGASWAYVSSSFINSASRFAFDTADGDALYITSRDGLVKTTDGGSTWHFLQIREMFLGGDGLAVRAGTVFLGNYAGSDAFVYKVDTVTSGYSLVYGTYLGGSAFETGSGIAVDDSGSAYVVTSTSSPDFPNTTGRARTAGAIVELNADASRILYSTFVGPTAFYQLEAGIALDRSGAAYVVGSYDDDNPRVWIDRVNPAGDFEARQFLDGTFSYTFPAADWGQAIAVDSAGAVYVTGGTNSSNFPVTPDSAQPYYGSGWSDAFITKLSFADVSNPLANVALNRPVAASSTEALQYSAGSAVDGSMSTRWSSQFSDPQWIAVDLGEIYTINHFVLRWEAAYAAEYQIQSSYDGWTWTTVLTHTKTDSSVDDLTGVSGTGRFFRMLGIRRGTPWGYSLWELELYGAPAPAGTINRALNRNVRASSQESLQYSSVYATDGTASTRWSSQFSDPQWIYVDLGQPISVAEVKLTWETAFAADYQIQLSDDAINWTTVRTVTNGAGGVDDLAVAGTGRYVRMYGTRRGTPWGYSLWELEVYGTPAHSTSSPTTP